MLFIFIKMMMITEDEANLLSRFFYIFSDPTRLKIISALLTAERGSRCVNKVSEYLSLSQPVVSQQLRILKDAGLVTVTRDRQFYRYAVADKHVAEILQTGLDHIYEKTNQEE